MEETVSNGIEMAETTETLSVVQKRSNHKKQQ